MCGDFAADLGDRVPDLMADSMTEPMAQAMTDGSELARPIVGAAESAAPPA
jgi:hypothetical protein